jgi:hypothetical protein
VFIDIFAVWHYEVCGKIWRVFLAIYPLVVSEAAFFAKSRGGMRKWGGNQMKSLNRKEVGKKFDLIYEGITTVSRRFRGSPGLSPKKFDLIYEGITPTTTFEIIMA